MLARLKFDMSALVNHMLDQLPADMIADTTFFDPAMGGGQFVREIEARKRALGLSNRDIRNSVFGIEGNSLRRDYAVNRFQLAGTYETGNILTMKPPRRFGVIVGNPPYQDPNNDKRMLWNQILDRSMEFCEPGGHLLLVTPSTWLTANTNIHNSYRLFEQLQVEKAVIYDRDDRPFDEGTSVSYTITRNVPRSAPTKLYFGRYKAGTEDYVADLDIRTDKVWPAQLTPLNLSIHKKLQKLPRIRFVKSCEFHAQKMQKKGWVSDVKSKEFPYVYYISAAIIRYTSERFSKHDQWKVMVPLTSTINRAVISNNCGHGADMLTLYVDSKTTAENIQHLFNTKTYRFIGRLYKSGRNQPLQDLFPVVDYDRRWTDQELYKLFRLNKQECQLIESEFDR